MTEPDDLDADLIAYLDGELDGPEAAAVADRLARDPAVRAKAEAYKKTYDLLDYLPKPDPSPDFASRTLTKLNPVTASASLPAVPAKWSLGWATWLVAALLAAAGGYVAHAALRPYVDPPPRDPDVLAYDDVRVVENLPLYLGVDDLAFLRQLDDPEFFAPEVLNPAPDGARLAMTDRDKLTTLFKSYPLARQHQLREFDEQFRALPAAEQSRLGRVLESYAVWLDRLPDAERKDVLNAATATARLEVVGRVHERAWRDGLPASSKTQLKNSVDDDQQLRLIESWKTAERTRRDEWQLARRQWDVLRNKDQKPWPFSDAALAKQVEDYVKTVLKVDLTARYPKVVEFPNSCRVTFEEFQDLRARSEATKLEGQWSWVLYGSLIHHLAVRHPSLPEPERPILDGMQLRSQLPDVSRTLFPKAAGTPLLDRKGSRGKWPEFALDVAIALRGANMPVPESLGPCRPGKFSPRVEGFLTLELLPQLTDAEKASLKRLEGQWPEYPRQMLKLAEAHDLSVPGVTLPGKPSEWATRYLPPPPAKKE